MNPSKQSSTLVLNKLTLSKLLKQKPSLRRTTQIHAQIITQSLAQETSLIGLLVQSYSNCRNLPLARSVFDQSSFLSHNFIWNTMIQAYSKTLTSPEPIFLFQQMLRFGGNPSAIPDAYTFTFVITACSRQPELIGCGRNVHGMVFKHGFDSNVFVGNSLLSMYVFSSEIVDAQRVFDEMSERDIITWTSLVKGYVTLGEIVKARELFLEMPQRNDVSWTVMISGYARQRLYNDALKCFSDMLADGNVRPNEAVLVSALSACADLGALDQGKWIHIYIDKSGVLKSSNISTALIDMYAKCGRVDSAKQVYDGTYKRDLPMWTSMISGLSMHGLGKEALEVFYDMLAEGLKPDDITLVGVLNACSHSGLVEEGLSIFDDMKRLWGIKPKLEHYGCLVDLLSRAGRLENAFEAVKSMPIKPDIIIWRALLSACRVHGNVELGERIISHISQMESNNRGGGYVLLSNLYAYLGQWDKVSETRNAMTCREPESSPGCSYIEIHGVFHEFLAADRLHPQIVEINKKLIEVMKRISLEDCYIPITKQVLFDLSEEDRQQAISWHSEKLAVAFGLMSTAEGTPILIMKNLRICEDCHSAMKAISRVFSREIIVRDRSRFHTFKDGYCSCTDYW